MGESVQALPADLRQRNPAVRLADVAGPRDVLIRGYHHVNLARVRLVVEYDSPELKSAATPASWAVS